MFKIDVSKRLRRLRGMGRASDGLQVLILLTMGQYFYTNGAVQLSAPHWHAFRDWLGGQHNVGLSVIGIGVVGLFGIFWLAISYNDLGYHIIMSLFSILAIAWCWTVAGFQTYVLVHDHTGNAGLWSWGMAGLFFLFTRLAIMLVSDETPYTRERKE